MVHYHHAPEEQRFLGFFSRISKKNKEDFNGKKYNSI